MKNNLWLMNSKGFGWTQLWLNLRYYPALYLERLRTKKILNRNLSPYLSKQRNANHLTMMFGVLYDRLLRPLFSYSIDIYCLHDQLLSFNSYVSREMVHIHMCNPVISITGINSFIFFHEFILWSCGLRQDVVWLVIIDLPGYTVS
jgi:hypothetical protein